MSPLEIGTPDEFHEVSNGRIGVINEVKGCINNFGQVMGRNIVLIPTAMLQFPLNARLGKRAGITNGSSPEPSKVGMRSTVSFVNALNHVHR